MYIQNNTLLVKKIDGKKLAIGLMDKGKIQISDIEKITQKELQFFQGQSNYSTFENLIYNKNELSKVLYQVLFIRNISSSSIGPGLKVEEYLDNFPVLFTYESNKTEGSRIPFEQLKLIFDSKKLSHTNKNEITEVKNSIKLWKFLQKDFLFNHIHIKKIYHILTRGLLQESGDMYPRGYRKIPVVVNNRATSAPDKVYDDIQNLLDFYKSNKKDLFFMQLAFDIHLQFEKIHPFVNGNGRIGRFIMNKVFITQKILPCIIFSENRSAYFNAIASTYSRDNKKYYNFMLSQYSKTLDMIFLDFFDKK